MATAKNRRARRPRPLRDVRTRIFASYLLLLLVATGASVVVVREALIVRLDHRIEDQLGQEVREFRSLADGVDPNTGEPFGTNVRRIFAVFLERNVPAPGEQLVTVPRRGVARYRAVNQDLLVPPRLIEEWRTLRQARSGEFESPEGVVRYAAIPVVEGNRPLGSFAVVHTIGREREEVDDVVRVVGIVAAVILLLGTALAFLVSRPVLAPLRELRDAAQSISGTELGRRIQVDGRDEIADLARQFNTMLDRIEHAFSTQRDFIRDVSHELRTPIAVIRGHLELLADSTPQTDADRRETIDLMLGEIDRVSRFVDDLLLLAKAERADFLVLETVDPAALCDEVVAKARALAQRTWKAQPPQHRSIVADRERLTQALMNLITNAVAHTEEGDEITVGGEFREDHIVLWVADTGPGIPQEELGRIFQRFQRGAASRRRYEGAGLGLAIVQAIATAHGGRAEVASPPGEGARFELVLPVDAQTRRPTAEVEAIT